MKTWIKAGATSAACILLAGMAGAQTDSQTADTPSAGDGSATDSQPASNASGGISPGDMMCADVIALDQEAAPGALYYIIGYQEGRDQSALGAVDAASTGEDAGASDTDAMASGETAEPPTATDDAGAAEDGSSDAESADTATGIDHATQNFNDGAAEDNGQEDGQEDGQAATDATGQDSPDQVAADDSQSAMNDQMRGFFDIPVDDVIAACTEAPERRASDVVNEHRTTDSMDADSMDTGSMESDSTDAGTD